MRMLVLCGLSTRVVTARRHQIEYGTWRTARYSALEGPTREGNYVFAGKKAMLHFFESIEEEKTWYRFASLPLFLSCASFALAGPLPITGLFLPPLPLLPTPLYSCGLDLEATVWRADEETRKSSRRGKERPVITTSTSHDVPPTMALFLPEPPSDIARPTVAEPGDEGLKDISSSSGLREKTGFLPTPLPIRHLPPQ